MGSLQYNFGLTQESVSEISETEHHLHNYERWLGAAAVPDGEVHVADRLAATTAAFVADAGNNAWGTWLQVLGSADTPVDADNTKFDFHRLLVTTVERIGTTYFIQVALGATGDGALLTGDYTELLYHPAAANSRAAPVPMIDLRHGVGSKAWLRTLALGEDTGTIAFFIGLHEYVR